MFRSLRNRLIFSHILPALLLIPLMGAVMVHVLETRLLMPMIYANLTRDATLMAEITRNQPVFWQSSEAAQALVDGVSPYLSGRLSFVSLDGRVLAVSDATAGAAGSQMDLPDMSRVAQGKAIQLQQGPLAEAFTTVYDLGGTPMGIVRMTTRVLTVSDEVYQFRYLLGAVLLVGVLAGIALGSYLAFTINRPIQRVTRLIHSLADGNWQARIEEQGGPDETRTLVQAVNTLVERLNSAEKARRQLLANLVHELGRPLGAIRSAISALLKGADKDPHLAADLLNGMDGETARLQRLLDDLARLHDQVLGSLELNRAQVAPNGWLAGQLPAWEAAAREKGLLWEAEIPPGLPAVTMDPDRMGQALGNLLSNAIKFTPTGGKVSTRAWMEGRQLCLQVSDSGPGIPEAEREKIFEPFYRGAHGRRIVQGMGLGLSIARDITAAHGGEITLETEPGKGNRFTLRVPADTQPQA